MAQVWKPPALIAVNRSEVPTTEGGETQGAPVPAGGRGGRGVVVGQISFETVPVRPNRASPQHQAPPSSARAHECMNPALTCEAGSVAPVPGSSVTGTGVVALRVRQSPSCPSESAPQQYGVLPDIAQVCCPPTEIEVKVSALVTSTGMLLPPVVPLPSSPRGVWCSPPQQ